MAKSLAESSVSCFFNHAVVTDLGTRIDGEEFWLKLKFENAEILSVFQVFQTAKLGQKGRQQPQSDASVVAFWRDRYEIFLRVEAESYF